MTKLFMGNGTIMEVSDSVKTRNDALLQLKMMSCENIELIDIRLEGDNRPIVVNYCADYCKERYQVDQNNWSLEAVEEGQNWRCSCSE